MFLGGVLAASITGLMAAQWVHLGRIPAGFSGGGIMGAVEIASVGLTGSMALVLFGATWSLLAHAIRGRRGPLIPAVALRVFGVFMVAMLGVLGVLASCHGQWVLSLITFPVTMGLAWLFFRRRSSPVTP